jgi:uncharacterized repeat protein (TIGR01451 family)
LSIKKTTKLLCVLVPLVLTLASAAWAEPGRVVLHGHVPAALAGLQPKGRVPATNLLTLAIGLPLRNPAELEAFLGQLYDPQSPGYHQYLTPTEFADRFGPSVSDYESVAQFAETNGFTLTGRHGNRLLIVVQARAADVERAFHVTLHSFRHPREDRDFYAPDVEPSVPEGTPVVDVQGMSDFSRPHPLIHSQPMSAGDSVGNPNSGSGPGGNYRGGDFRAAYVPGTRLTGANQVVGLVQFDGYYVADITNYENQAGLPNVPLQNVYPDGYDGTPTTGPNSGNPEVSLDIEMVISMAPGIAKLMVYEGNPTNFIPNNVLSRIATDNQAKQVSSSWSWNGGPDTTTDNLLSQMAAQGQSFFQASGDSDAYTGANVLDSSANFTTPIASPYVTAVGGTTLTTTGPGGAWTGEKVWNWNTNGQPNVGSSGGISTHYSIPSWQAFISTPSNHASSTMRNVPDVALTADNVYVIYNHGSTGSFGGTSCAAPLWAGFCALMNQQAAISLKPAVGFLDAQLYSLATNANYTSLFHDTTTGNNIGTNVAGLYNAVAGYDLCTGLGTPNGTNLISTIVPLRLFSLLTTNGWTLQAESATPANGVIDPGETVTVGFTLQNQGALDTSNLVATLQANAGVLAPGSPQTYGVVAGYGGVATKPFTFTTAGPCGSNIVAVLQLQDGTNNLGTVSFLLPLGQLSPLLTFSQNFDGVANPALPSGWTSVLVSDTTNKWLTTKASFDTSPNSAFCTNSGSKSQNALVSPVIPITSTSAQLVFRHNYSFEYRSRSGSPYRDGGVLEIKIGNGSFTDITAAGGSFVSGGYTNSINSTGNPLYGRSAWVNSSLGWRTVTVNLPPSAAGQNIQLRWNLATDTSNSGTGAVGWYVDSVSVTDAALACLTVLADVAVGQTIAPNSLQAGQNLVYTLAVTNLGPQPAASVVLTDTVPVGVTFVSASPGCAYAGGNVVCPAGTLAANAFTNFTVTLAPAGPGSFTNVVGATTVTPETSTANDVSTLISAQTGTLPAAIVTGPSGQAIQCAGNASFSVVATGTPPRSIQWSLDGAALTGATNSSFSLTNIHMPNHTVSVTVTNVFGGATSNALLTVFDTLPPVITLNGGNPIFVELGGAFFDPGAMASDACAGAVSVMVSGSVNASVLGTNLLTYTAADGSGNTNSVLRSVIIRDTTPPTIVRSFTNLVLAVDTNCSASMPDVTGTNFIVATDASGAVTISQSPTNAAILPLGTNLVFMAVKDGSGNTAYSTNTIVVQDQTPPRITAQPQNQTNFVGGSVTFGVAASACTPLAFQWYFNSAKLAGQTNGTLTLSNLATAVAGPYFVTATAFGGSSTSLVASLTVNLLQSTVALASSEDPAGYRDVLAFTAHVTPTNASGSIQFTTNGATFDLETLAAGFAVSTNPAVLPRGTNIVTAVYSGDASFLPSTNTLAQVVTNHPPVAAPVFTTNTPSFTLGIPIATLAANWSDVDGDPVSIANVGLSTNGITLFNAGGSLVYSNASNVADLFTCTVTDNFGGVALQSVYIAPAIAAAPTPQISGAVMNSDGSFSLSLGGAPGRVYVLEMTPDFYPSENWQPIATNTLGTNGVWLFTDPQATNFQQGFFRLRLLP